MPIGQTPPCVGGAFTSQDHGVHAIAHRQRGMRSAIPGTCAPTSAPGIGDELAVTIDERGVKTVTVTPWLMTPLNTTR